MIFVAVHTHTPDKCPINNPDRIRQLQNALSEEEAERNNCKLISLLVAPTEHTLYITLESDSHASMVRFMKPLLGLGITKITPADHWKNFATQLQNPGDIATRR